MNKGLDRKTDIIATVVSTVVACSIWGLFLYEYLTPGDVPGWLMAIAVLFTFLAVITLFGVEKVRKAIELRSGGE